MCGIAGVFRYRSGRGIVAPELTAMADRIAHRGPDDVGYYIDGEFGVAHTRLSIIDTSERSSQPMVSSDQSLIVSFNGEIYNYLELRESLRSRGIRFRTESDTEVLLEMYRLHGVECLQYLNGMFAFAIWDTRTRSLFLARDHVGIKPLYFCRHAEGISFASEVKALLVDSNVRAVANQSVLDAYLRFGYVPGEQTMFAGVDRLLPGHYKMVRDGKTIDHCYWDIEYCEPDGRSECDYVEEATFLMQDAVRLQLRSDVPLGIFLSGGVDSSAMVALTQSLGERSLNTYSVSWDHGRAFDESHYARLVSKRFNTNHHEYWMKPEDFTGAFDEFTWLMDEPVTEAPAISLYKIAQVARRDVTVVLSGEGSDEVFGGYPIYLFMDVVERYKRVPKGLRGALLNPLLSLGGERIRKYVRLSDKTLESSYMGVSFYDKNAVYSLLTDDARKCVASSPATKLVEPYYKKTRGESVQRRMQYLDLKTWLVDDLLIKADRMTMGASQELRVPFLDYRLLEFASRLPTELRIKNRQPKYLMKKAMEQYLPKEVIYRKKRGFPTPISDLFKGDLRDFVGDILTSRASRERGVFAPDSINRAFGEHTSGAKDHHRTLWQALVLENWHRTFVDADVRNGRSDQRIAS